MTETSSCIDKDDLVAYLYGEVDLEARRQFDVHLQDCPICADEVLSLKDVRGTLDAWVPPDAQLGFRVVTTTGRRHWEFDTLLRRVMPPRSWGIAAMVVLVLLAAVAVTRPEIEFGPDWMLVRIGWSQSVAPDSVTPGLSSSQPVSESELAQDWAAVDSPWLQRVHEMIRESERRQVRALSDRVRQVEQRIEEQRRADLSEMERTFREVDPDDAALARQQLLEYMSRISARR